MLEDVEPSILEYARFYGIALDHLKRNLLHESFPPDTISAQLEDPPGLFRIDNSSDILPLERLSVGTEAAALLASIRELGQTSRRFDEDVHLDVHRFQKIKQELPILLTDHELDLQSFASQIVPDLENEHLPFEILDEEADEGLKWPSTWYELPARYFNEAKAEKSDTSKEGLLYLQDVLRFVSNNEDDVVIEENELFYRKRTIVDPLTPPLLPRSPDIAPFEPSSDTGRLEFLSDLSSPTREEARDIDKIIFEEDAIVLKKKNQDSSSKNVDPMLLDSDNIGDVYSPLRGIEDPPSSPPFNRVKPEDLKVEGPLTPPISERPPPWNTKNVSFSDSLHEIISKIPSPIENPEEVSFEDIDAFFAESIAPVALKAERNIEQEQLEEADTTRRVNVPVMDFSLPTPPWSKSGTGTDGYQKILSEMKQVHLSEYIWPIEGKVERELKWTPFPAALGRVATQEKIPDDGTTTLFVAQPERVDISTLTWKPEGLRILDDLSKSDDEDLEYATFAEAKDLSSLIRKRKFELQEIEVSGTDNEEHTFTSIPPKDFPESKAGQELPRLNPPTQSPEWKMDPTKQHQTTFTEPFSAMSALDNFMTIRTGEVKKPDLGTTPYFPPNPHKANLPTSLHQLQPPKTPSNPLPAPPAQIHFPILTPSFTIPTTPHPFIISASLLRNRKLTRQIQSLYPTAEFISRDFTLHTLPRDPHQHAQPSIPETEAEADLLLSPSTGLILTSLPHLTQLPLPSQQHQKQHPPIFIRILATLPRYAHLLILITLPASSTLSEPDTETLTSFTAFCASLSSSTATTVEPITTHHNNDTENTTAQYIAALMCKHGGTAPIPLLQDETLWEIWLRRAGMNAFAAQDVLGMLKNPQDIEGYDDRIGGGQNRANIDWGLAAFVKMHPEERVRRFGRMLGGRGLLERVGRCVDGGW